MKELKELDILVLGMLNRAPHQVRNSEFGCRNCLWCSIECKGGSKYKPKTDTNPECDAYVYYD